MKYFLIFLGGLFVGNMVGWWRGYRKAIAEDLEPELIAQSPTPAEWAEWEASFSEWPL